VQIVRFKASENIRYGVIAGDEIKSMDGDPFSGHRTTGATFHVNHVKLLAPVVPSKIVGIGLNYSDHAAEMNFATPKEPLIFLKAPSALNGPGDPIRLTALSEQIEFEGELAIIIGGACRNVGESDALRFVLGYSCFNDVTARDLLRQDGQFVRAKSFDTFACMGPHIETELDTSDLTLETRLNGKIRQQVKTSQMLFNVPTIVSYVSRMMSLLPGDVITTGTPSGVGKMSAGDRVAVSISGIGTLENPVVAE